MEDEANCLAGYILIPNEAAQKIVWSGHGCGAGMAVSGFGQVTGA